jgi:hypothetical protein
MCLLFGHRTGGLASGASVSGRKSRAWILPWVANSPPFGTTFILVGLVCAATGALGIRGPSAAAQANAVVMAAASDSLGSRYPPLDRNVFSDPATWSPLF